MTETVNVGIKFLDTMVRMPRYAHHGDAGLDLTSVSEPFELVPGERRLVPTGIALAIPEGWVGLVHPRSGLALKKGLTVLNTPGTIDSGYRGEIQVILVNLGSEPVTIDDGERIAQIVFQRVGHAVFHSVEDFNDESTRGEGGFGSTGAK